MVVCGKGGGGDGCGGGGGRLGGWVVNIIRNLLGGNLCTESVFVIMDEEFVFKLILLN